MASSLMVPVQPKPKETSPVEQQPLRPPVESGELPAGQVYSGVP